VELSDGAFLPVSAINALRRAATHKFESCGKERETRVARNYIIPEKKTSAPAVSAQFMSYAALLEAAKISGEIINKIDYRILPPSSPDEAFAVANAVAIPPVVTDSEEVALRERLNEIYGLGVRYALCGNIGHIAIARECGFSVIGDFRLNVTNRKSCEALSSLSVERLILSPELTSPKARDVGGGIISYGRIPLMLTERCFISENFGCDKCGRAELVDRRGECFPMLREAGHRNLILNSVVTYMGDRAEELSRFGLSFRHLIFTVESGRRITEVLSDFFAGKALGGGTRIRRAGRRDAEPEARQGTEGRRDDGILQGKPGKTKARTITRGAENNRTGKEKINSLNGRSKRRR